MRIPYWNIDYGILIDAVALPAVAIFVYGLYGHYKKIRSGKERLKRISANTPGKIGPVFVHALLTKGLLGEKIYRKLYTGIAHGFVFWGMVILAVGTGLVLLNVLTGLPVFSGGFNSWFMGFTLDLAGAAVLCGLIFLMARRIVPPDRLVYPKERKGFLPMAGLLAGIVVTGFLIEGLRISATGPDPGAFVGNFLSGLLPVKEQAQAYHQNLWWLHGLLSMAFIAYIPFSPMVHIVLAPVNAALADPMPGPKMGVIDFSSFDENGGEDMPPLGVSKISDFSSKRLLDFSTCLWCGRCQEACPAAQTEGVLSPKAVMVTLAEALSQNRLNDDGLCDEIGVEALFKCTTCAACMEVCPVCINQPKSILKLRQNLVMERSELPELMSKAHNSLEQRRHPFFGTGSGPNDWKKGMDAPLFDAGETEYLLWIGCAATYDERAQKIARAMVTILKEAQVSFGVLAEFRCTGDPAKQMGNEFLFAELAQENIAEFDELGVKKIITLCPHCFNSFTRHYPELGGNYEVIPHAVMISDLISARKLSLNWGSESVCLHDPCYLARRNHIEEPPRRVIQAVGKLVEMPRHGKESFCCGGGGGNYWSEASGVRINQVRAKEALDTGSSFIATSCPFCLLMLTDGAKKYTEEQKVLDIAELVEQRLKKA